jgi:L-alanine-DL-glutamate epimerase-like enolase superfamily enzyme
MREHVLSQSFSGLRLRAEARRFELLEPFSITRFTVHAIEPIWVTLFDSPTQDDGGDGGGHSGICGRGEGNRVDYGGETAASLLAQVHAVASMLGAGVSLAQLDAWLPAGAARNALSCALLDIACKRSGRRAWDLLVLPAPQTCLTCNTIGLASPADMARAALRMAPYPLLKVKLGQHALDAHRIEGIRRARPDATLLVDANAGWTLAEFRDLLPVLERAGVVLVEQPLPHGADAEVAAAGSRIPLAADESVSDAASLAQLPAGYSFINIKLDKTGGLPEALRLAQAAQARGLGLMLGNMMGSSLGMAPAFALTPLVQWVDLDGPIDLVADCDAGFAYQHARMPPPRPELWG